MSAWRYSLGRKVFGVWCSMLGISKYGAPNTEHRTPNTNKYRRRLGAVSLNAMAQLLFPVSGVLLSWSVFRFSGAGVWGGFVDALLFAGIAPLVMSWGNKEYLLRAFSQNPAEARQAWRRSFGSRVYLALPLVAVLLFFPWPLEVKAAVFAWCVARFLYQSYDVVILYGKKFAITLGLEAMAFAGLLLFVLLSEKGLTVSGLISAYALAETFKALLCAWRFRRDFSPLVLPKPDKSFYLGALSFFLLGFSGFLQSRMDLLCINYFLPDEAAGRFQVFVNLLLYLQATSAFMLQPFLKNLYRMGEGVIRRIALRLFLAGLGLVCVALPALYFFLPFFYGFALQPQTLLLGGLSVLPVFYYSPFVYRLFKENRQGRVIAVSLGGIAMSFMLNVLLIPVFENGMDGALLATALTQVGVAGVYGGRGLYEAAFKVAKPVRSRPPLTQ